MASVHCMLLAEHEPHTWHAPVYGGAVSCPGSVRIDGRVLPRTPEPLPASAA